PLSPMDPPYYPGDTTLTVPDDGTTVLIDTPTVPRSSVMEESPEDYNESYEWQFELPSQWTDGNELPWGL
ncbi:hypothetical protein PENTCL1PPCAC_11027, partial [Pristionchus entomophagus]